jgi:phosphatidate cytidylyltransferase
MPIVPASARPPASRWADLRLRVLSAAVLAPLALGCIWVGGAAFAVLLAAITAGLAYEWLDLCRQRTPRAIALFVALPVTVLVTAADGARLALGLLAAATIAGILVGGGMSRGRPLAFGFPYLGLGGVALIWLRQPPVSGGANVIVLLLIVWASDIGAYLTGRAIGGPRLAPAISPGKTWSGAIGGLAAAAATGLVASSALANGPISWRAVGDLFESQLKRHFGVKDSGHIIPGHGGLLDRLDGVLSAAPTAALLALIFGRGVVLWE